MGLWNNHGMSKDEEEIEIAIDVLGLMPEELVILSDNAKDQAWIYERMRKHESGQRKRKLTLMIGFWKRRSRKLKELAAAEEDFYAQERGEVTHIEEIHP
jgi:hypothetical protein